MTISPEQQAEHQMQQAIHLAEQLLDAQVEFVKSRLTGSGATHYAGRLIDFCLAQGEVIQLNQIVSVESIKQVVQVYAFDLNLGGGIMELIGAIAQRVYQVAHVQNTTLQTLMTDQLMEQWIEKILELDQVREHIRLTLQQSPGVHEAIKQITSSVLKKQMPDWQDNIQQYLGTGLLGKTPLAKKFAHLWREQQERLLEFAEQHISHFIQQQGEQLLTLDTDELKDISWQIWQQIKTIPLNELSSGIESLDIEEFFVLIYEFWRHLRQTAHMQLLILTGIEVFFELYGEYPVAHLLEEIGISREHLINDANRFLPQAIQVLNQHNVLDQLIRLQLQDFYRSDDTLQILHNQLNTPLQ